MSKSTYSHLEVLFKGRDLYPEKIPLGHLSRALNAVQRLSLGDDAPLDDDEAPEDGSLRLVAVRRGSAVFPCVSQTPEKTIQNLRLAGSVLTKPELIDKIAYAFNPIEDLSAIGRSLDCSIILKLPGREGEILARIEPDSYKQIAKSLLIEGDTTVTGRLERVGGATAIRCALRIATRNRLLFCRVESGNPALVKALAARLYEDVAVTGKAKWLRGTWRIVSFTVKGVFQPETGKFSDMIGAVRKAGGDAWDRIPNPEDYLKKVSGEG